VREDPEGHVDDAADDRVDGHHRRQHLRGLRRPRQDEHPDDERDRPGGPEGRAEVVRRPAKTRFSGDGPCIVRRHSRDLSSPYEHELFRGGIFRSAGTFLVPRRYVGEARTSISPRDDIAH